MVQVILVRHGETDWNKSLRIQGGNSDTELNEKGQQQAEWLGLRLKQERIQAVYSSPLKRALDTAQAIAHHHQLEVQIEPALKELNVGELEGVGRWRFYEQDGVTAVLYEWNVATTKPWMNRLAPLLRPAFEWNHDWVMARGGEGIAKLLGCRLLAAD